MFDIWVFGLATIVIATLIYNIIKLITHPSLPLPPGPKPWPILGNIPHMGAIPHQSLAALAQKHGPLMHLRLGFDDAIVTSSAAVAEQCLKVHDANFVNRPINLGTKYIGYGEHGLIFAPYGPRWRVFRKLATVHLFSGKALDGFRHIRQEEAARMVRNLASSGSKAVKLGQQINVCIANGLSRVVIGRRVFDDGNGGCDPKADEFKSLIFEALALSGVSNIEDFIPPLKWLDPQGLVPKMKSVFKRLDQFLSRIIEEHKTSIKSEKHDDFLSILLSLKDVPDDEDGGVKVDDTEIKALLLNMLLAGTETSTNTVEWLMSELMKNPSIISQMHKELDSVVGRDRPVSELDIPNLLYLEAVVKETFRLHPVAPLSLPRFASESCEILGYHIPKKSTLLVNVWAIGRDPKEWSNPLEFRPERFLPNGEKAHVDVKGNDFEVIPFGAGRRICSGMMMGLRVVSLWTATLLHAFDWELENGLNPEKLNMDEALGLTAPRAVPLKVHPRPRLLPHVYSS